MVNRLFNPASMKEYIKKYEIQSAKHSQKVALNTWIKKLENGDLKDEVANYGRFSRMILETILGYDYEENILHNDKDEYGRGLSDFALKKGNKKFMVIELKGSDADLDKPQNRVNDKRTPVDQAFDYAKRSGDIDWIFVSNYKEFRLYNWHKKQHNYISFMAEDLVDPENFKSFMLVFSKKSHIDQDYLGKLLNDTIIVDKDLEKNFYNLFHETRLMLIKELEYGGCKREKAIEHAQTILNRYIFICFAEDKGLLPAEISIKTIINPLKEKIVGKNKIWKRLNELFSDMDTGERVGINQFNGKLFSKDLSSLPIRDLTENPKFFEETWQKYDFKGYSQDIKPLIEGYENNLNPIYKNLVLISTFDFSSQLDVNILGHIFENSIGDIEDLKKGSKGRRKKDGIFYTPNYITDYICKNSIIPYLSKTGSVTNIEDLIMEYSKGDEIEELESKVMNIKILDPSCGSGAFLNKASDILLEIHKSIYNFKKKKYVSIIQTKGGKGKDKIKRPAKHSMLDSFATEADTRKEILINNIYGVDLNEESVEITKLAFFLKVAQKEKKLPDLNKNIKCGNSLIDDPEYAEEKAFNWKKRFPEIKDGKFDVIIGNPPYVEARMLEQKEVDYFRETFLSAGTRVNTFSIFLEKSLALLDEKGFLGVIIHKNSIRSNNYQKLRKLILDNCSIEKIVSLGAKIFENVTGEIVILLLRKELDNNIRTSNIVLHGDKNALTSEDSYFYNTIPQEIFYKIPGNRFNIYLNENKISILKKIELKSVKLKEKAYTRQGIIVGDEKKLIKHERVSNKYKPILRGKNISRYKLNFDNEYVLYAPGTQILKRGRTEDIFERDEKILTQHVSGKIVATLDSERYYALQTINLVFSKDLNITTNKYLLTLLNSKLINFYYDCYFNMGSEFTTAVATSNLDLLPIVPISMDEQKIFIEKADNMLKLNKQVQEEVSSFNDWLMHTFSIDKLSKKMEKYYELSLDSFFDELKKKKVDIKSRKTYQNIKDEFEKSFKKISPLIQEINKTNNELDELVYDLYNLTFEERKIVEESLK